MSAAEVEEDDESQFTLANSDVCTKYREAGRIANLALKGITSQIVDGAKIVDICKFGDTVITQACSTIYQKKVKGTAIEKGIAFPTCCSVNEVVCHYCPLEIDGETGTVKAGDLVKVDLGVHVDGYIVVLGDTVKVGVAPTPEEPLGGDEGKLFAAAHAMGQVATKLITPGKNNVEVTEAWEAIAGAYGVNLVEGTLSHQMKRYVIDGNKVIIGKRDHVMKVDVCSFEPNEVYSVDVCLSTGDGKPRQSESRTTVFKRAVDKSYRLKMKASRYLFNEVNSKYPTLPFTLRAFDDEKSARMGVVECQKHELVAPYPVLLEKEGALVVHLKFTVLILPSGTVKVTESMVSDGAAFAAEGVEVPESTKAILALSSKSKKKKKKKAKAGEGGDAAAPEASE